MRRTAFTLVEVMVALVVTGLVVAMAYGAMQAGLGTLAAMERAQEGVERETIARSLLARAIRHAAPGTLGGAPVFVMQDGADGDAIRFQTRGINEPLGASALWEVTLRPAPGGVNLSGFVVADSSESFSTVLPQVRSVDVRLRGRDVRDGWFDTWPFPDRSPVAVSITFLDGERRPVGAPLVSRVGLEGIP